MTINNIFTMYSDPGHAWLQVTHQDFCNVGLRPIDFSEFSFRGRDCFYLEEDCDAPKFLKAYESLHKQLIINNVYTNSESFIRLLPSINYPKQAYLKQYAV